MITRALQPIAYATPLANFLDMQDKEETRMTFTHMIDHIQFAPEELDELEEQLIPLGEHNLNAKGANALTLARATDPNTEARREIIGVYKEGVLIASSVEAYPLLCAAAVNRATLVPSKIKVAKEVQGFEFHLIELVFLPQSAASDSRPTRAEFAVEFACSYQQAVMVSRARARLLSAGDSGKHPQSRNPAHRRPNRWVEFRGSG